MYVRIPSILERGSCLELRDRFDVVKGRQICSALCSRVEKVAAFYARADQGELFKCCTPHETSSNHPQANIGLAQQSLDQPYSIDRVAALQHGFVDHVTHVLLLTQLFLPV
jgi:hypothetical protein